MMTQYLKAPPFEYITMVVGAQAIALLLLSMLTIGLMLHRNWRQRRLNLYIQEFSAALIEEIMGSGEGPSLPPRLHILRRHALKTSVLGHLKQVSGPEKALLARRYETLGFARVDLAMARSWFWWRRLHAVANLSLLDSNEYAPNFSRLINDRNDLVIAFSFIPLSRLSHPLNAIRPIANLPAAVLARENVTHEILRNWAHIHGHAFLIEELAQTYRPDLLMRLVRALASEATPDVAEAFAKKLGHPGLSSAPVAEMLTLLRRVGDPANGPTVRPYLDHENEGVRLRALEYFLDLGDLDAISASRILGDQSIAVRRALKGFYFKKEEAA